MFNKKYFEISPMHAREIALAEVGVKNAEFTWQKIVDNNGSPMYELDMAACGMVYSFCIDANSGEILGFMCEPKAA